MIQTAVQEVFMMDLKVAFIAGFILTAPYALVQIWGFIAAGLYPHERKWVRRFVPVSIALFFIGALFMLFVVAPVMLNFFIDYGNEGYPDITRSLPEWLRPDRGMHEVTPIAEPAWPTTQPIPAYATDPENPPQGTPWLNVDAHEIRVRFGDRTYTFAALREAREGNRVIPMIRVHDYVLLVLGMMAAFGIGFQMPVVVALLSTIGIFSAKDMAGVRRHVLFAIAIASAIITPSADVISMLALMVPMALLFEVGLLAARFIEREREQPAT
jgi:Sec-independent protein secretion pathway component TatC